MNKLSSENTVKVCIIHLNAFYTLLFTIRFYQARFYVRSQDLSRYFNVRLLPILSKVLISACTHKVTDIPRVYTAVKRVVGTD